MRRFLELMVQEGCATSDTFNSAPESGLAGQFRPCVTASHPMPRTRTTSVDTAPLRADSWTPRAVGGVWHAGQAVDKLADGTCDSVDAAVTQDGSNRSISGIPT